MTTLELVSLYMKHIHRGIIFKTIEFTYNPEYGQIFVTYTKSGDEKNYTEIINLIDYITFLFNTNYRNYNTK